MENKHKIVNHDGVHMNGLVSVNYGWNYCKPFHLLTKQHLREMLIHFTIYIAREIKDQVYT